MKDRRPDAVFGIGLASSKGDVNEAFRFGTAAMSSIGPVSGFPVLPPRAARRSAGAVPASESRALVPVEAVTPSGSRPPRSVAQAALIAQLSARRLDLPQTRRMRRADTAVGAAAYEAMQHTLEINRRAVGKSWVV